MYPTETEMASLPEPAGYIDPRIEELRISAAITEVELRRLQYIVRYNCHQLSASFASGWYF